MRYGKLLMIMAVLCLALGIFVGCGETAATTKEPEQYYADKEMANIEAAIGNFEAEANAVDPENMGVKMGFSLKVDEKGYSFIKNYGLDLSQFIDKIDLSFLFDMDMKQEAFAIGGELQLNGVELAAAEVIADMANELMYLDIPLLSDKIARIALAEVMGEQDFDYAELLGQSAGQNAAVNELLPYLQDVAGIMLDNLPEFMRQADTELIVAGVKTSCTQMAVTLTEGQFAEYLYNCLKAFRSYKDYDAAIEKLAEIIVMVEPEGELTAADTVAEMKAAIDEQLAEFEQNREQLVGNDMTCISYNVWFAEDEIIGREILLHEGNSISGQEMLIGMATALDGGKLGERYYFATEELGLELVGTAKKNGNTVSDGEYTLSMSEYDETLELLRFELKNADMAALDKGSVDCALKLRLGSGLMNELAELALLIGAFSFDIDIKADADSFDFELGLCYADTTVATLGIDGELGKADSLSMPAAAVDMAEYEGVMATSEAILNDFVGKLKEAGVKDALLNLFLGSGVMGSLK